LIDKDTDVDRNPAQDFNNLEQFQFETAEDDGKEEDPLIADARAAINTSMNINSFS